jgi:serine/threonine protein kinase
MHVNDHSEMPASGIVEVADLERQQPFVARLEEKFVECQLETEGGKFFIPRRPLEQILDEDTVRQALQDSAPSLGPDDAARCARRICAPDRFREQGASFRKIFTILVLSDMISSSLSFLEFGVDDSNLPMPNPKHFKLYSPDDAKEDNEDRLQSWHSLVNRLRPSQRHLFFMLQWSVMAPVFESVDRVTHFSFSYDCILPFLKQDRDTLDLKSSQARYGGYSEIRQIKIHPDHYNFGEYGVSMLAISANVSLPLTQVNNPNHLFALKRLHTTDNRDLGREVDVLKRFRNVARIIQLLATFEVYGDIDQQSSRTYYLIFPWAAGDLLTFWEARQSLVADYRIVPWISEQCYELAKALSTIHQDANDQDPGEGERLYGRHGDIKPSNILWFPPCMRAGVEDIGQLVIGDFGLGQFHSQESRSAVDPSSLARSPSYRPPEFDKKENISRKIDIWSLGCTFLEFITWFLMGFDAVSKQFPQARSEPDIYDIGADTFFRIVKDHDDRVYAIVKPQVTDWIDSLHTHEFCSQYMHDFLDLIQTDMLVAEPQKRSTAFELSHRLQRMYDRCQDRSEDGARYYQVGNPWPPRLRMDIPLIKPTPSHHPSTTDNEEATSSNRRSNVKEGLALIQKAFRSKMI